MVLYLTIGIVAGIVVSFFTKPVKDEQLDSFYALTRTPVGKGEILNDEPCTLPKDAIIPQVNKLFNHKDFEILKPSKISLFGFGISWVFVAILVWSVFFIVSIN